MSSLGWRCKWSEANWEAAKWVGVRAEGQHVRSLPIYMRILKSRRRSAPNPQHFQLEFADKSPLDRISRR